MHTCAHTHTPIKIWKILVLKLSSLPNAINNEMSSITKEKPNKHNTIINANTCISL